MSVKVRWPCIQEYVFLFLLLFLFSCFFLWCYISCSVRKGPLVWKLKTKIANSCIQSVIWEILSICCFQKFIFLSFLWPQLDQITTAGARAGDKAGGYLQWRPVSYMSSDRDIGVATTPNLNTSLSHLGNLTDPLKASLAYAVLGEKLNKPGAAVTSVISFGQSRDGFYRSENYTTWYVAFRLGCG